jgi:hypothetical protein
MNKILTEKIDAVTYVGTAASGVATSTASWAMERFVDLGTDKKTPRKTFRFPEGGDFLNTQTKSNPCGADGSALTTASFKWDDRVTLFWDGDDTTVPTLASAVRTDDTHITVTMSETCAVNTITKSNAGGFTVNETGSATAYAVSAVAPGATNDKVVLTVANLAVSSKEGVTVKYASGGNGTVKDSYGNVLATNATGVAAPAWDLVAPTLSSALVDSDTQVTVTLSESMDSATVTKANAGGFVVKDTVTPATTYAVSAIAPGLTPNKVVLTVANMGASSVPGITVTYAAGGNGTAADVGGNLLATNAVGVAAATWDSAPRMSSASRIANTTVRVTLSEVANNTTITKANAGGFVVYETGTPGTTYAVSAIAPNGGNYNQVDLTVASILASAAVGVTVTYVAGGDGTVADSTANLMATDATGVLVAAW